MISCFLSLVQRKEPFFLQGHGSSDRATGAGCYVFRKEQRSEIRGYSSAATGPSSLGLWDLPAYLSRVVTVQNRESRRLMSKHFKWTKKNYRSCLLTRVWGHFSLHCLFTAFKRKGQVCWSVDLVFCSQCFRDIYKRRDGKRIKWLVNINVLLCREDTKTGIRYCKNISFIWIQRKRLVFASGGGVGEGWG